MWREWRGGGNYGFGDGTWYHARMEGGRDGTKMKRGEERRREEREEVAGRIVCIVPHLRITNFELSRMASMEQQ